MGNKLTNLTIFRFAGRASRVPAVIALLAGALFLAACGGGGGAAPAEDPPADEVPADSPAPPAPLGPIERVSLRSDGTQANGLSAAPAISADGRYVAFWSDATDLVDGDTNAFRDVFVRDTVDGTTTRVSVHSDGSVADSVSRFPAISGDGRYVAFVSFATNLVADDTNGNFDTFVRDTVDGTTTRVSVQSDGSEATGGGFGIQSAPAISGDGRYVAFWSDATNLVDDDTNAFRDVFVRDTVAGTTTRVSQQSAGGESTSGGTFIGSFAPAISGDGRYVAFRSLASNLVAGDSNGLTDVFVRDTVDGTTTRVSLDSAGTEANGFSSGPAISADGRYVAFSSLATNLVGGDSNGLRDMFVRDTVAGTTTRVSLDSAGTEATGGGSFSSAISGDGRYVAFDSNATNLVDGDSNASGDVFVRDTVAGTTTRVSLDSAGAQATGGSSFLYAISADGRYVALESDATNLVAGDSNGLPDVFRAPAQ